jgi:hypothetical protein
MKLAIMQPYFFPYLSYFQLLASVDAFVIYDDVNYRKGGWINRNNLLSEGNSKIFTLEVKGASQNKLINQIEIGQSINKLLQFLYHSYRKAPEFSNVYPLIEKIMKHEEKNLALFLEYQLREICSYLGLSPSWYVSSTLNKNSILRGQDKIILICENLGGKQYVNLPGGKSLYSPTSFAEKGIQLSFIESREIIYDQFGKSFVSNLSIIDVLMFNDKNKCFKLLNAVDLVSV